MRILVTIPHFFRKSARAEYGSEKGDADRRLGAISACVHSLRQTFGYEQAHMENLSARANERLTSTLDIVVCTSGDTHLVAKLPKDVIIHNETNSDPRLLGYECHKVLAENIGLYDYYCFMEDDLILTDPLFFWKIAWFSETVGAESVLQPHRFELLNGSAVRKLYIDSRLADPTVSPRFQDRTVRPKLTGRVLGREISFERVDNPHSGCFFLNEAQLRRWMQQPFFLDYSSDFAGPLESAATLGLMKTFLVYKADPRNAGFLELRHADNRYLGTQIKFPGDYLLKPSYSS